MKRLLPFAALMLAGCATDQASQAPTPSEVPAYGASSHDPFWTVAIGKGNVVMTRGPSGGAADGELVSHAYPAPVISEANGVRRWESGAGTEVIAVEARAEPCSTGGRSYPDRVKVYLSGVILEGCGGEEVAR